MNLRVSEEERSAIELGGYNLGGYSYKSDVFKKPNISHAISPDHAGTEHNRPSTLRTNNLKESDQDSDIRTQQPELWAQHLTYGHSNLAIGVRTREYK